MKQSINKKKVEQALEGVCQLGCMTVREIIKEIERGVLPEPATKLSALERECLLDELKAIMQTYQ